MQEFDKAFVEGILCSLDEQSRLFPQFAFTKSNNGLKLLGAGGFSSVYEMYDKARPELPFALKVIGLKRHTISSAEFRNTSRIQWILCQESNYIMRVLDARELLLFFDDKGNITEVKDAAKDRINTEIKDAADEGAITEIKTAANKAWEEKGNSLHLQFVLTERLDQLIEKDRFGRARLLRKELNTETEVLRLAFEIGQALALTHNNKCLHRDIKIENIFWDTSEQVYKLGDFGIAKWAEDGNAETIVYTDGYGAPEIERRLYDSYNATADIYSLGITLYLLLNDLRFPGSDGYYPKVEVQYHPEFVFPAPVHASEEMARVIRKMCSFYAEDRYQSMNGVLLELSMVLDSEGVDASDELFQLADIATETYKEEKAEADEAEESKEWTKSRAKTRAERKEEQRIVDIIYREESIKYFVAITILLTLLFKGLQPDSSMVTNWMFFALPAAVLFEALLQRVKEFYLFFGTVVLVFAGFSIYSAGLTVPHIILILCVLVGRPVLALAGAVSTGFWMLLEITGRLAVLDYIEKWDLGWIILIALALVVHRYFYMRIEWEKSTYIRIFLGMYVYVTFFLVLFLAGVVLLILQKCSVIVVPDIVGRMHLIRTGIISYAAMCLFEWRDGVFDEEDQAIEEGEESAEDDELLDE